MFTIKVDGAPLGNDPEYGDPVDAIHFESYEEAREYGASEPRLAGKEWQVSDHV